MTANNVRLSDLPVEIVSKIIAYLPTTNTSPWTQLHQSVSWQQPFTKIVDKKNVDNAIRRKFQLSLVCRRVRQAVHCPAAWPCRQFQLFVRTADNDQSLVINDIVWPIVSGLTALRSLTAVAAPCLININTAGVQHETIVHMIADSCTRHVRTLIVYVRSDEQVRPYARLLAACAGQLTSLCLRVDTDLKPEFRQLHQTGDDHFAYGPSAPDERGTSRYETPVELSAASQALLADALDRCDRLEVLTLHNLTGISDQLAAAVRTADVSGLTLFGDYTEEKMLAQLLSEQSTNRLSLTQKRRIRLVSFHDTEVTPVLSQLSDSVRSRLRLLHWWDSVSADWLLADIPSRFPNLHELKLDQVDQLSQEQATQLTAQFIRHWCERKIDADDELYLSIKFEMWPEMFWEADMVCPLQEAIFMLEEEGVTFRRVNLHHSGNDRRAAHLVLSNGNRAFLQMLHNDP